MNLLRETILKQFLANQGGVCFSAYFPAMSSGQMKSQIETFIRQAIPLMEKSMEPDKMRAFLEPIQNLKEDVRILRQFKSSVGIFRNEDFFRAIHIPIPVEPIMAVSTSFHVKPLLKWAQQESEFFLLGFDGGGASLYKGSLAGTKHLDTLLFPEEIRSKMQYGYFQDLRMDSKGIRSLRQFMIWVEDWLKKVEKGNRFPLFVAGDPNIVDTFFQSTKLTNAIREPVRSHFTRLAVDDLSAQIKGLFRREFISRFENRLVEFLAAEKLGLTRDSLSSIARAATEGRVKTLFVAENLVLWGNFNRRTGQVVIQDRQRSDQDEDVLDDIAETVIKKGGEVILARADSLPLGKAISAILHPNSPRKERSEPTPTPRAG